MQYEILFSARKTKSVSNLMLTLKLRVQNRINVQAHVRHCLEIVIEDKLIRGIIDTECSV